MPRSPRLPTAVSLSLQSYPAVRACAVHRGSRSRSLTARFLIRFLAPPPLYSRPSHLLCQGHLSDTQTPHGTPLPHTSKPNQSPASCAAARSPTKARSIHRATSISTRHSHPSPRSSQSRSWTTRTRCKQGLIQWVSCVCAPNHHPSIHPARPIAPICCRRDETDIRVTIKTDIHRSMHIPDMIQAVCLGVLVLGREIDGAPAQGFARAET